MTDQLLSHVPPHSHEAERAVLGALLIDPQAVDRLEGLEVDDFYSPAHARVFAAALALHKRQAPVDLVALVEELDRREELNLVGGAAEVAELAMSVPTSANAEYYGRLIRERAMQRAMIEAAARIQRLGFATSEPGTLAEEAERILHDATQRQAGGEPVHISKVCEEVYQTQDQGLPDVVPTGFLDLDDTLAPGFLLGELVLVGGQSGSGKSTWARSLAERAARSGHAALYFSLEMPRRQVGECMAAAMGSVVNTSIRSRSLSPDETRQFRQGLERLSVLPLWVDDHEAHTVFDVCSRTRRLKAQVDLRLVVVDYVQRLKATEGHRTRREAVMEMGRQLKTLARNASVVVVAAAQLARRVNERASKRPLMSDLQESSSLEQDADKVLLIHRPSYHQESPPKKGPYSSMSEREWRQHAEIIIAKNRNGPTGTVAVRFEREHSRFVGTDEGEQHKLYCRPGYTPAPSYGPGGNHD